MGLDTSLFEINVTPYFYSIDAVGQHDHDHHDADGEKYAPSAVIWVNIPCDYTRHLLVHAIAR